MASKRPVLGFPRATLDQSVITSVRQRSNKAAVALARGGSTIANLIARPLRPSDVNNTATPTGANILARLSSPALAANVYNTDVWPNLITQQTQGIVLNSFVVFSAVPFIDEITLWVGALPVAVVTFNELYAQGRPAAQELFFFDPIMVPAQTHLRIDLLSSVTMAAGAEQYGLAGYVGEAVAKTVNLQDNSLDDLVGQFDRGNLVVTA